MNPFRWSREHQVACIVVCLLGTAFGLFVGFFTVVATARSSLPAGTLFKFWIQRPDLYWPWPTFGAVIAGLAFYAVRTFRHPRTNENTSARADVFYPVIARAIAQLPDNTREPRRDLYDRARATLRTQLNEQHTPPVDFERDRRALEFAIRKIEKESSLKARPTRIPLRDPRHHPTTAFLVVSIFFFPGLWALDFTSMSLYWVARLPRKDVL
jgi:hypothetical protein